MVLRAQAVYDSIAVEPRHHDVEDHGIIDVRFVLFRRLKLSFAVSTEKPWPVSSVCSESASRRSSSTTRISYSSQHLQDTAL